MSWQTIVDSLMSSKHMAHAGIFGHDGNSWATTKNFPVFIIILKKLPAV
jgi:hypothetical protein